MKGFLVGVVFLALTGCATPTGDMLNNQFDNQVPSNQENVGYYTGSVGPYTVTLQVNKDGTGYSCESMGSAQTDRYLKIKLDTQMIYFSNGGKFKIAESKPDSITMQNIYFGMNTKYILKKDDLLTKAAPFCESRLK